MVGRDDWGHDPDFDVSEGLTESPDVSAAQVAYVETMASATKTQEVVEESRAWVRELREIRLENHFTEKLRKIIRSSGGAA